MTQPSQPRRKGSRIVRVALRGIVAIALLLAAGGFMSFMINSKPTPPKSEGNTASKIVRVMSATPIDTRRRFEGFGTARAKRAADITAEIDARVVERPANIDPGVRVKGPTNQAQGTLLAKLDQRDFTDSEDAIRRRIDALQAQIDGITVEQESLQARLSLAQEAVRLAELDIERLRDAIGSGVENPTELDRQLQQLTVTKRDAARISESLLLLPTREAALQSQLAEQRATLRTATLNIERTQITAPFDGMLQTVQFELGERVSRGQVVARLVDLSVIEIPIRLPASAALDLKPGVPVTLIDERADGSRGWTGTIARLAPEIDASTRTLLAFVEVAQEPIMGPASLLPGTFVHAVVDGSSTESRLVIPRASIADDRVWIVNDQGALEFRAARPLFPIDGSYPDLDPLETDWIAIDPTYRGSQDIPVLKQRDRVVLNPSQDLRSGKVVRTQDDLTPSTTTLVSTPQTSDDSAEAKQ